MTERGNRLSTERILSGATMCCALAAASGAVAQEMSLWGVQQPNSGGRAISAGQSQLSSHPTPTTSAVAGPPTDVLDIWGPIAVVPHLRYSVSYGDGLQSQPGAKLRTVIHEVAPGVQSYLGEHWTLDYTPAMFWYSSSAYHEHVDQTVLLNGNTSFQDWRFNALQSYHHSEQPLAETAAQTAQDNFQTSLKANRVLSSKLSLELGLSQDLQDVERGPNQPALSDSRTWSTMDWLDYQIWPQLSAGVGAGFNYSSVSQGSDMAAEQLETRLNWLLAQKLVLSLNVGLEDRQFLSSSLSPAVNPVFDFTAVYRLFEKTTLSVRASRSQSAAYLQSQMTEATEVTATLRQRLLGKLEATLGGGYGEVSYSSTVAAGAPRRVDDHANVDARLSYALRKRATISLFYDWTDHPSNQPGYEYSSSQVGLELTYRY